MDFFETINSAIKSAMLAKDKVRLQALRGIKKEFIEAKTAPGANGELSDDAAMKILVKMAKQRSESAEINRSQNRPDLAETEEAEMTVIKEYLPQPLSAEELDAALSEIIAKVGASSAADMGKVMGVATKQLAGRADGKAISAAVRRLLS